jgi:hypothetical protein
MKQILIVVIVVLLCVIGYLLFINKPTNETNNNNTDSQTSTEPKDPPLSPGWSLYRNEALNFKLAKPDNITVDKEYNDSTARLVTFTSNSINFEVRLEKAGSFSLDNYHYLDFISSGTGSVGGEKAAVFKAPKGYCDGPECSRPFVAYSVKHGDDFYNLVFYGDTSLNTIEQQILGSFIFIK